MAEKHSMQADGAKHPRGAQDGVEERPGHRDDPGESGGGAYPNPHTGKAGKGRAPAPFHRGGQTEADYYGPGQLGGGKADTSKSGRVGQGGTKLPD